MSFDLTGLRATTEDGSKFNNSAWWWRPLWNYCRYVELITDEQHEMGMSNSNFIIPKEQSVKMGIKLQHLISQRETQKYADEYAKRLKELPSEECRACSGTGRRNGTCNLCHGEGKRESWDKSYPFSVDNVEDFAKFCIESGGFSIC